MGNAKLWWYPSATGTVEEIDLGEGLSDLQVIPRVDQAVAEGISGVQATTHYSARHTVRLIDERFTSASLYRKLAALGDHLRRGGLVAVAEDSTQAWAAFAQQIPARGATTINHFAHPWPFNASPTLQSGAEVEVVGAQPLAIREIATVSGTYTSVTAGTLTLGAGLVFDQAEAGSRWVLVRSRGFWPLLRLPIGERNQPIVTDDHRITYTLDVVLEEAIDQYEVWASTPGDAVQTTTVRGSRRTLEAPEMGIAAAPDPVRWY